MLDKKRFKLTCNADDLEILSSQLRSAENHFGKLFSNVSTNPDTGEIIVTSVMLPNFQ